MLAPLRSDEGDTDFAAQPPHHLASAADALVAGDQQIELIGCVDAIGKQTRALLGHVGDRAVARERAGICLEFGDPVDGIAPVLAAFLGWRGSNRVLGWSWKQIWVPIFCRPACK